MVSTEYWHLPDGRTDRRTERNTITILHTACKPILTRDKNDTYMHVLKTSLCELVTLLLLYLYVIISACFIVLLIPQSSSFDQSVVFDMLQSGTQRTAAVQNIDTFHVCIKTTYRNCSTYIPTTSIPRHIRRTSQTS